MDSLLSDIRFAFRSLGKARTFTAVALLSLALGIGVNVTVFSVVNSLAFKRLPYDQPDRLVDLHEWSATKLCSGCSVGVSYPTFLDWRASARSFIGMGAYSERPFAVSGSETAERVGGAIVSAGTFELVGAHASLGRAFVADDDRIGATPVVVLSDALWNRRYGGDRRVVGQMIRVNGIAHTVIGIMPPRFKFPEFAELWVPFVPNASGTPRDNREFDVIARLKPGVTVAKADAEMAILAKGISSSYPDTQAEWTARATPLRVALREVPPGMLAILLGAVGFVLLIVCANLAGLLLARGANRRREIAIRLALGATRRQIVWHLLTESLLLSTGGGLLGLLVAMWGVDFAVKAIRSQIPFYIDFGLDAVTFAFCAGVSLLAGILFGLLPALRASSPDVHTTLKETSATVHRSHARGLLVIGELALAMVLLAGAGELMKAFLRVSEPEAGYDERNLLTGRFEFLDAKYGNPAVVRSTSDDILGRIAGIPGVSGVALDRFEFIRGFGHEERTIRAEGIVAVPSDVSPTFYHVVSPAYFVTIRLPLLIGRGFNAQDRAGSNPVGIVNQQLAEALWPGQPAIGRRIKLGSSDSLPWVTIVGIAANVSSRGKVRNYAYVPFDQQPSTQTSLFVRAGDKPLLVAPALRSAVRSVDPDLPVLDLQTIAQRQHDNYWPYELYSIAIGIFAGFAILLAAIGLYGVIAYNTAQRTREIGVRIALGAAGRDVVALIARQGGRLVILGIIAGLGGSALMIRLLGSLLFQASPLDFSVYASVSALLIVVAAAAIWLPARRAASVSPLEALRAE
jgi:putative ABC transport system permease protein